MDNLYDRQQPLELHVSSSAAVVGVGGVGSWVAILAAMSGVKRLVLYDGDILEETNLNRVPLKQSDLGHRKDIAVAEFIKSLRPQCFVETRGPLHEDLSPIMLCDVVFDCTDRLTVQQRLSLKCRELNLRYIRAGYDGTHITLTDKVPWGEAVNGYRVVPSWVVPAAIVAALAVGKALKFADMEVMKDVSEL